jgi:hypothetical protein
MCLAETGPYSIFRNAQPTPQQAWTVQFATAFEFAVSIKYPAK